MSSFEITVCALVFISPLVILAIVVAQKAQKNRLVAQVAEKALATVVVPSSRPETLRYAVRRLMDDEELARTLLRTGGLDASGPAITIPGFPTVAVRRDVGYIQQDGKTFEIRIEGQTLSILERGPRGGLRETTINVTALLRVFCGLGIVREIHEADRDT